MKQINARFWLRMGLIAVPLVAVAVILYGEYRSQNTPDRAESAVYLVLEKKIPRISAEMNRR